LAPKKKKGICGPARIAAAGLLSSKKEEKGYLRTCKDCGGRFIIIQKDERISGEEEKTSPNGR
jgi:hypothetical protein